MAAINICPTGEYYALYDKTTYRNMVLTRAQMETNALWIYNYCASNYGWTINAVAGMLGNMESESSINPARPQNNAVTNQWYPSAPGYAGNAPTPTDTWYGFGLTQVTPYLALTGRRENPHTYGNWALRNGFTFDYNTCGTGGLMEPQLDWFNSGEPETPYYNTAEPSRNQAKWYQDSRSPLNCPTVRDYARSTASVIDCATTFYWNWERSGAEAVGTRTTQAVRWYEFLSGHPVPPTPGRLPIWLLFKFKGRGGST